MSTNEYYKSHMNEFCASTIAADVSDLRTRFIQYLPTDRAASVLDLGCGTGRDTRAFYEMGYQVDAIDALPEFCEAASAYSGIPVRCMTFLELDETEKYDGIWACASLLHAPLSDQVEIYTRIVRALRIGGCFYVSYKYGDFEGERNERFFLDMNEELFQTIVGQVPNLKIVECWKTTDVRPDKDVAWYNAILKREK